MFYQPTRFARRALLTTVSAAALVLAANNQTEAQDAGPIWWASVEGQYNWVDGDAFDIDPLSVSPEDGWAGKLHFGGMLDHDWSASVGIRYGQTNRESDNILYSEFGGADAKYDESHLIVDLEIGRDVGLGSSGNARIFGGLRFAQFDGDADTSYSGFGGGSASVSQKFSGIGPRLGMDAGFPLTQNLRADLGVAGAVLYGKRKVKVDGSYSGFGAYDFSSSSSKHVWVPNAEASVALSYLLTPNASISAGYKAEQFWNVMPTVSDVNSLSTGNDDRLIHGPFLKLTITGN
jgi:hypothetical protein